MRIGAFEVLEPLREPRNTHALVMIRPWVDVGSVGSLTLRQLERHFQAQKLGALARPGTFFDFTRYRPSVKMVNGQREMTYPNSFVNFAPADDESEPDLLFLHLLEPHAMAEDYIDSIVALLEYFKVSVYCRIGAMYDSVPHTRPLVVTGNPGPIEPRAGAMPPLVQQRQSQYEGPTTIMNRLNDAAVAMDIGIMSFMAHLPHYAQLDEDFAGTARMLEVLAAFYDFPATLAPVHRGRLQYAELDVAMDRQPAVKSLVARLESHYDVTYQIPGQSPPPEEEASDEPAKLSPEIEQFLKDLDLGM
ncbi:MAG: PAC2 family protein [Chloroflexi bacterium]|nr:PAC2 family protein [Chloroflexota bacterium]